MAREFHNCKRVYPGFLLVAIALFLSGETLLSCPKNKRWKQVSRPEKVWSIFHPFKAKKVYNCAAMARVATDSLKKAGVLKDGTGGQLDAFRHAYWTALLITRGLKEETVRTIGEKHEKGNYLQFKKGQLEDSLLPDSMATVMDLKNNDKGISIAQTYLKSDKKVSLINMILNEIWDGKLFILRKDTSGDYLDCKGEKINLVKYRKRWGIPKCLVSSEQIPVAH